MAMSSLSHHSYISFEMPPPPPTPSLQLVSCTMLYSPSAPPAWVISSFCIDSALIYMALTHTSSCVLALHPVTHAIFHFPSDKYFLQKGCHSVGASSKFAYIQLQLEGLSTLLERGMRDLKGAKPCCPNIFSPVCPK